MRLSLLFLLSLIPNLFAAPSFERDIAPLLVAKCLDCHSGPKPKGGLDLSTKATAFGKKTIIPGKLADSRLWQRVHDGEMPPKKPLPTAEQQLLKDWITSGAEWTVTRLDPFQYTTANRGGYDWWSLKPITKPTVPELNAPSPIDRFILTELADKTLRPSPKADKRTLLRRWTYDLTGLPPTPTEVANYLADRSPEADAKVVDRLLASPHFGERQARAWMDVVRYGESDGFERNMGRKNAWPYRDWLISAFNSDLPYNRFAAWQLAGDILEPTNPDAIRATGFLVAGVHNTVLGNDQMRAIARQDELEDIVGTIGQTFLGLTINCARCHDHKFDAISQKDYYRFTSALSGVTHGERSIPDPKRQQQLADINTKLQKIQQQLATLEAPARQAILGNKEAEPTPFPVAAWDFRDSLKDQVGTLKLTVHGNPKLTDAGVVFDGKNYLVSDRLPKAMAAKTLEAWVRVDPLSQRGGGVMTLSTADGNVFDSIVFGELQPQRWMAGSENFRRSASFNGAEEQSTELVHIAYTYAADGTITAYRNGQLYGKPTKPKDPVTFAEGQAVLTFGIRHLPAGGNRMFSGTLAMAKLYDHALSAEDVGRSYRANGKHVREADLLAKLTPPQRQQRSEYLLSIKLLQTVRDELNRAANQRAHLAVTINPGVTRLLIRGQVDAPAEEIAAGGVAAIKTPSPDFRLAANAPETDRRKALAMWITSPENPLFARVMVNRVWHQHFGMGLVETPNDFGFNGGLPSHPALLDWLAHEFQSSGFSLKKLHRQIVLSHSYMQQSAIQPDAQKQDADNRLLWRKKPTRMDAESLRDTLLAVAGLLNRDVGGPSFSDYQETFLNGTTYFEPIDPVGPEFHRRSVYRFRPRGANVGLLDAFDCPDPATTAPRRAMTITPLQALALWNNGFVLRMAEATAIRIAREHPQETSTEKIRQLWQVILLRDPTVEETKLAAPLVTKHGLKALARALFNTNEFMTIE